MSEQTRESGKQQGIRILHNIDKIAKRLYKGQNGGDEKVRISMWEVLSASDVSRSTFYHINYPQKIGHRAGLWYDNGKLTIKPETYLRNRDRIDLGEIDV